MVSLKGRNFLTLKDFTSEEIEYLIDLAAQLKKKTSEDGASARRAVAARTALLRPSKTGAEKTDSTHTMRGTTYEPRRT